MKAAFPASGPAPLELLGASFGGLFPAAQGTMEWWGGGRGSEGSLLPVVSLADAGDVQL